MTRKPVTHRERRRDHACHATAAAVTTRPVMEPMEERRMLNSKGLTTKADLAYTQLLTTADVQTIVAQAASQAVPGQVICVTDRDGHILALFQMNGTSKHPLDATQQLIRQTKAIDDAVTAAFFESTEDAFTTRTARFIIQDHFPQDVQNTPGGPLYGVEFSSQPFSDVFPKTALSISGDPGGVPLFKNGVPVGGIGVSGDGHDVLPRGDIKLPADQDVARGKNGKPLAYTGPEEADFDEAVAQAGAKGFMAPDPVRADKIFVGGLRFPFVAEGAASANKTQSITALTGAGAGQGQLVSYTDPFATNTTARASDVAHFDSTAGYKAGTREFPLTTFQGFKGELRDPIVAPNDGLPYGVGLTKSDITKAIANGVKEALSIRAAIRQPIGVAVRVHISVVDLAGNVVGTFRMNDGTNFSYDVAVQKARTAAYFSSDTAAFSDTALGFLAQRFFPPGQAHQQIGPLFHIQNDISGLDPTPNPNGTTKGFTGFLTNSMLRNGITIFPGGFPLYKNGRLVGAIGVSGDGVTQDNLIAFAGSKGLRPPESIQSDHLRSDAVRIALEAKLGGLQNMTRDLGALGNPANTPVPNQSVNGVLIDQADTILRQGLEGVRLPYAKFPRNPGL